MGLFDKRTPAEKIRDTADALLQKGRYAEAAAQYAKLASTPELDDLQARCLLGMAKSQPAAEAADTRARARALLLRAVRGGEDAAGQLLADAFGLTEFLAPLTPPKPESPVAASYRPQYLTALDAHDRGDYDTARYLLREAAHADHPGAQLIYGIMYLRGDGVERNLASGVFWMTRAAELGSLNAQFRLGLLYRDGGTEGIDFPQDEQEALRWLERAAEQGDPEAQYNLAVMLLKGDATAPDRPAARRQFEAAAAQGHEQAREAMQKLFSDPA